jgi:hypothetical protein
MTAREALATSNVGQWMVSMCSQSAMRRSANSLGTAGVCSPRKSLIWVEAISSAMPLVKPMVTGARNKLDGRSQTRHAHDDQNHSGHHGDHEQSGQAELGNDAGNDDHKRAGRPADLCARSAQRGNEKSGHYRRINPCLRRDARSNAARTYPKTPPNLPFVRGGASFARFPSLPRRG